MNLYPSSLTLCLTFANAPTKRSFRRRLSRLSIYKKKEHKSFININTIFRVRELLNPLTCLTLFDAYIAEKSLWTY